MWEGIELAAGMADLRVDQLVDLFKSEYWRRIEQRFNERVDGVQRGFEGLTHALDVYLVYLQEEGFLLPTIKLEVLLNNTAYKNAKAALEDVKKRKLEFEMIEKPKEM